MVSRGALEAEAAAAGASDVALDKSNVGDNIGFTAVDGGATGVVGADVDCVTGSDVMVVGAAMTGLMGGTGVPTSVSVAATTLGLRSCTSSSSSSSSSTFNSPGESGSAEAGLSATMSSSSLVGSTSASG